MIDFKTGIIIGLTIVTGAFIWRGNSFKSEAEFHKHSEEVMSDSVEYWIDKDGKNIATISSFESDKAKDFIKLETKDKDIIALQESVEKYKKQLKDRGSSSNFDADSKVDTVFKTKVIYVDSLPVYFSEIQLEEWVTGTIIASQFETELEITIKNKYSVIVGDDKDGLFKKSKPFVIVENDNPYTEVTSLRAYQVKLPKPKKIFIGPFIGLDYNLNFTIGIGVGYGLIRL